MLHGCDNRRVEDDAVQAFGIRTVGMGGPSQPEYQQSERLNLSSVVRQVFSTGVNDPGLSDSPTQIFCHALPCLHWFRVCGPVLFGRVWTTDVELLCSLISTIDPVTRPTAHGETAQTRFATTWSQSLWPSGIIRPWPWSTSINSQSYIICLAAMRGLSLTAPIPPPCLPLHSRAHARNPSNQIILDHCSLSPPNSSQRLQSANVMPLNLSQI